MQAVRSKAELQTQKNKLTSSYNELLEEFSSKELSSVGNYTLGRLIGKGSFGKVYLATHKLTNGSKVVLKSAKKDDANLAREIHHHRQFLHPHIARLYEVIVTENLVWLVLEYCPGDELYNYLCQHGPLPTEKVQRIFTQLVGAVSYVHNMSCVHRDLKLENILLDRNENVKLCDFGFTREYEGKMSNLQTFCGTVAYSAPEMLKGEKYAGEKVDVWSLGIILYALLAGELPFDDDDDLVTKHKILSSEPHYPETAPPEAKSLTLQLLSKRPLVRPSLADILTHPFLAGHAPAQHAILKLARPAPFTTSLEKETLHRMNSAGINIDKVVEHVLAQRCDALAGWWALLIEKEERKEARREQKRKEKEQETKSLRRISAASSRRTPTLQDVDEENSETTRGRGRRERISIPNGKRDQENAYPFQANGDILQVVVPELPRLPEGASIDSPSSTTPPPIEKDSVRSLSSSRHRPPLPPKERERRRSRGSALQLVTANPDLFTPSSLAPPSLVPKRRNTKRHPNLIINQLSSLKHWFVESAKRARSPGVRGDIAALRNPQNKSSGQVRRGPGISEGNSASDDGPAMPSPLLRNNIHPPRAPRYSNPRSSLSPAPLTPHSSVYRRSSAGLRGRKSTSSSVSSIRSIHHVHTHSKTSSTSSNTNSIQSSALSTKPISRSPHTSVKVLPATPTATTFPSNIRLVRAAPHPLNTSVLDDRAFSGSMPSPGLIFAKRKKQAFRGPTLHLSSANGFVGPSRSREPSVGHRSTSLPRRANGPTIAEEDEDEIEEVEAFSPLGVDVEETILDGNADAKSAYTDYRSGP